MEDTLVTGAMIEVTTPDEPRLVALWVFSIMGDETVEYDLEDAKEDVWRFIEDVWRFIEDVWRFIEDVWRFIEDVWRFIEDVRRFTEENEVRRVLLLGRGWHMCHFGISLHGACCSCYKTHVRPTRIPLELFHTLMSPSTTLHR